MRRTETSTCIDAPIDSHGQPVGINNALLAAASLSLALRCVEGATALLEVETAALGSGFRVWEVGGWRINGIGVGNVGVTLDGGEGFESWGRRESAEVVSG